MDRLLVPALPDSFGRMIVYPIPSSTQRIVLPLAVVQRFHRYQQKRWWQKEAGGQLFARFDLPDIVVEEATGPRRSDWRTRYAYHPNRSAEQKEIAARHANGLHFVGDWHTHPETLPVPSRDDADSMKDLVVRSKHSLNGFLLVIVGRDVFPRGLSVSLFTPATRITLTAIPE
jgi:integrative and conjugative element protein (TIGR02256 family)